MAEAKICGINTREALTAALDGGADYVGFVFFGPSPRHLDIAAARSLAERARGNARIVALTVDAGDAVLDEIANEIAPDFLQLHGSESPERVAEVKEKFGRKLMYMGTLTTERFKIQRKGILGSRLSGHIQSVGDHCIISILDANHDAPFQALLLNLIYVIPGLIILWTFLGFKSLTGAMIATAVTIIVAGLFAWRLIMEKRFISRRNDEEVAILVKFLESSFTISYREIDPMSHTSMPYSP